MVRVCITKCRRAQTEETDDWGLTELFQAQDIKGRTGRLRSEQGDDVLLLDVYAADCRGWCGPLSRRRQSGLVTRYPLCPKWGVW